MRKIFLIGIVGIMALIGLMMGCDLFSDGTINFYSMVRGDAQLSTYRLRYRSDGWVIRMTCGQIGDEGFATKEAALARMAEVNFTLFVDGTNVNPSGAKTVEQLGRNAWHVVVPYKVNLNKGTREVIGTTLFDVGDPRVNTVNVTVH